MHMSSCCYAAGFSNLMRVLVAFPLLGPSAMALGDGLRGPESMTKDCVYIEAMDSSDLSESCFDSLQWFAVGGGGGGWAG